MKNDDFIVDYCVVGGWQELMPGLQLLCKESCHDGRGMVLAVRLGGHKSPVCGHRLQNG